MISALGPTNGPTLAQVQRPAQGLVLPESLRAENSSTLQDPGRSAFGSEGRRDATSPRPSLSLSTVLSLQGQSGDDQGNGGSSNDPQTGNGTDPEPSAISRPGQTNDQASAEQEPADAGSEESDSDGDGLNEEEEKQVKELAARDREVRAHEQAHARVGGQYASAPSYTFQQGPDGKRYAIGGEVQIDTSSERTPEATVRKMQIVIRAALAPAEPSSQDLKVAQQARATLAEAQAEARQNRAESLSGDDDEDSPGGAQTPVPGVSEAGNGERSTGNGETSGGDTSNRGDVAVALAAYNDAQGTVDRLRAGLPF